jgi:hypothetical protein
MKERERELTNNRPEESSAELDLGELEAVSGGGQQLTTTMISNLANMRHEMLKTVANNLRA